MMNWCMYLKQSFCILHEETKTGAASRLLNTSVTYICISNENLFLRIFHSSVIIIYALLAPQLPQYNLSLKLYRSLKHCHHSITLLYHVQECLTSAL